MEKESFNFTSEATDFSNPVVVQPIWDRGVDDSDAISDATIPQQRADAEQFEPISELDAILLETRWERGVDWPIAIWIAIIHIGALAAVIPYCFTWEGLGVGIAFAWLTGSIGVCMGYHRQLTHRSFSTFRWIQYFLAFVGGLSGEGSAVTWIANHRKHHAYSDHLGDPHSPRHGKLWSHMLWFCPNFGSKYFKELTAKFAPDLLKDPMYMTLHKLFLPSHLLLGAIMGYAGYLYGGTQYAVSFLVWGMFLRLVYVLHVTWCVNSASHIWGYKNYETKDDSRNNWWVGLLAFGEGWHNNHHAYPRVASQGHRWWEFDMTYWAILAMEKVGLAWNVVRKKPKNEQNQQEKQEKPTD